MWHVLSQMIAGLFADTTPRRPARRRLALEGLEQREVPAALPPADFTPAQVREAEPPAAVGRRAGAATRQQRLFERRLSGSWVNESSMFLPGYGTVPLRNEFVFVGPGGGRTFAGSTFAGPGFIGASGRWRYYHGLLRIDYDLQTRMNQAYPEFELFRVRFQGANAFRLEKLGYSGNVTSSELYVRR